MPTSQHIHLKVPNIYFQTVSILSTNTGLTPGKSQLCTNTHKKEYPVKFNTFLYHVVLPMLMTAEQVTDTENG